MTALMFASYFGYLKTVKVLVEKGAKVDAKDEGGSGPIDWSAVGGHKQIAQRFAEKGAKLSPKGGRLFGVGTMPLWFTNKVAGKPNK